MNELIETLAQKIQGPIDETLSGELKAAFRAQQTPKDVTSLWVSLMFKSKGTAIAANGMNTYLSDWHRANKDMRDLILEGCRTYAQSTGKETWFQDLKKELGVD